MLNKVRPVIFFKVLFLAQPIFPKAQDNRVQYPGVLANSFTGVNIGYINYPFSNFQLETGFQSTSVKVPHTAVRIILFGHEFNKYLSAQVTYMRPVDWVQYKNVNGDGAGHSVWMNVAGISVKAQTPAWRKFSAYGEAGFALITRHGFEIDNETAIKNANYGTILTGAGLQYRLNNKWQLMLTSVYSPDNSKAKQPHTIFYSGGFMYTLRALPEEKLKRKREAGFRFPKNVVQLGYTTKALGYGVNKFVSEGAVPIFWGGSAKLRRGISVSYLHNIFHSKKVFSLDWGANMYYGQSRVDKNNFFAVSLFPLVRFTTLRSKTMDLYFNYAVAGPTYISRSVTDGFNTGKHFTFLDFMGIGAFIGASKRINTEIRIMHYSNGNLFPENAGYMIPLTFTIGYSF